MWTASRAGFSLVEVMVVVGILSLLAALAVPRVGAAVHRSQEEQAARAVSALISSAQAKARAQERRYAVLLSAPSDRNPGSAAVAVEAGGAWIHTGERVSLPPRTAVNPATASIVFNERGLLEAGSPSRVTIGRRTLTITRWGEVRLE